MKTILAVIGAIVILGLVVLVGGSYWAYKKAGPKMAEMQQQAIEDFIKEKKPTDSAANALKRINNAAKLQDSYATMLLIGVAARAMEDGSVSDQEIDLLDQGSQMAEQHKLTKTELEELIKKSTEVMPDKSISNVDAESKQDEKEDIKVEQPAAKNFKPIQKTK